MFKKMMFGGALAAFLALGAGCGKADEAIKELESIKKKACECKDAACAEAVQKDFEAFLKKHENTKGSQSQAEKVGKIASEMSECLMKAATGGGGE